MPTNFNVVLLTPTPKLRNYRFSSFCTMQPPSPIETPILNISCLKISGPIPDVKVTRISLFKRTNLEFCVHGNIFRICVPTSTLVALKSVQNRVSTSDPCVHPEFVDILAVQEVIESQTVFPSIQNRGDYSSFFIMFTLSPSINVVSWKKQQHKGHNAQSEVKGFEILGRQKDVCFDPYVRYIYQCHCCNQPLGQ